MSASAPVDLALHAKGSPPRRSGRQLLAVAGRWLVIAALAVVTAGCADKISREELLARIEAGDPPPILDVRSGGEYAASHVPGAVHAPFHSLLRHRGRIPAPEREGDPIVVYCEHGPRAGIARAQLALAGSGPVLFLEGHMSAWKEAELPVDVGAGEALGEGARPALNEKFRSEDLDVVHYVEVFETESREIYAERKAIVAAVDIAAGMSVADVGAGTGLFLSLFAEAVGATGRVYAVDISPRFVEHLEKRAKDEQLAQVDVVLGGDRSPGLPEASVDRVFVCDTYHHFEHPRAMLASLHGAVRPGGELLIIDFERVPGESRDWIFDHVRAGKEVFRSEIETAGFEFVEEVEIAGVEENYVLRFRRP